MSLPEPGHRFTIPSGHPCLPGHFPSRPVVPGVVLVERSLGPLLGRLGRRAERLEEVKFLAPVLPDQEVTVEFTRVTAETVAFTASVDGVPVLRCRARLGSRK